MELRKKLIILKFRKFITRQKFDNPSKELKNQQDSLKVQRKHIYTYFGFINVHLKDYRMTKNKIYFEKFFIYVDRYLQL